MTLVDINLVDKFEDWLQAYDAITELLNEIYSTTVAGGVYTPGSVGIEDALRDLMETSLRINLAGIFADTGDHTYVGQFWDELATFTTVSTGHLVYMNADGTYHKAQEGVNNNVLGIADVANGKVMVSGFVATAHGFPSGSKLYLSSSVAGGITATQTTVPIGYAISASILLLDIGHKRIQNEKAPILSNDFDTAGNTIFSSVGNLKIQAPTGSNISMLINAIEKATLDGNGLFTATKFNGDGSELTHTDNWQKVTSSFTATAGSRYLLCASAALIVTLPASPTAGDTIQVCDANGTAGTYTITIARNSENIESSATNYVLSVIGDSIEFVYVDSTIGWKRTSQNSAHYA